MYALNSAFSGRSVAKFGFGAARFIVGPPNRRQIKAENVRIEALGVRVH